MKLNGDKLKDLRDARLLTQVTAAQKIGITVATLSAAENGNDVWPSTAEALCNFYNVEAADLVIPRVKESVDA